jgi:hypothetical protein
VLAPRDFIGLGSPRALSCYFFHERGWWLDVLLALKLKKRAHFGGEQVDTNRMICGAALSSM